MLELRGVAKRLGGFQLEGLDLRVGDGEYFVLLGPSGVGKTVLVELIAGLMRPDRGRILFNGEDITAWQPERRRFSIVYQDYALFPHMTVAHNIQYGMRPGANLRGRLELLAELVGISGVLGRRPGTLSGGEQQRTALARALASEPRLLLLDEPLSAVDNQLRESLRRQLKHLQLQSNVTVLHVTHDIDEAVFLGQRIGVMLNGLIRQTGTATELFQVPTDPEVAAFLGIRNILPVDRCDGECCQIGELQIHAPCLDSGTRFVWIRPEEIILSRTRFNSSARNQFDCTVRDWELSRNLVLVQAELGSQTLVAQITFKSFEQLEIEKGSRLVLTFKSAAVMRF